MSATLTDTEAEIDTQGLQVQEKRAKPKTGRLANKLIGRMEKENNRTERDALQLPSLGPLGDKSIWNF